MTTKLEIFNLAISRVGYAGNIASEDEDSKERKACSGVYQIALNFVLESYNWSFAADWATLAVSNQAPPQPWKYCYAVPSQALKIRRVMRANKYQKAISYDIKLDQAGTGRLIVTDEKDAQAGFTRRIADPTVLSNMAADAVATKMAVDISPSLRGDARTSQVLARGFRDTLRAAQASDAKEIRPFYERGVPEFISARFPRDCRYGYLDTRELENPGGSV